jgi:hypothetical protein
VDTGSRKENASKKESGLSLGFAEREMRAAERHHGAEAQCRQPRKHT